MAVPKQTYKITLIENYNIWHESDFKYFLAFSHFEKKGLHFSFQKALWKIGVKNHFLKKSLFVHGGSNPVKGFSSSLWDAH